MICDKLSKKKLIGSIVALTIITSHNHSSFLSIN